MKYASDCFAFDYYKSLKKERVVNSPGTEKPLFLVNYRLVIDVAQFDSGLAVC